MLTLASAMIVAAAVLWAAARVAGTRGGAPEPAGAPRVGAIARSARALYPREFDAIEREKLERYQERYEEYIRTAKALQALSAAPRD